jgi:hypothetical protein
MPGQSRAVAPHQDDWSARTAAMRGGQMPGAVTADRADLVHLRWGREGTARAPRKLWTPATRDARVDQLWISSIM